MTAELVVVGSANVDRLHRVRHLPRPGETVLGDDVVVAPGGKGANQAVAAARLGADVRFVGLLGDDADGGWYRSILEREGVVWAGRAVSAPTGAASIWVDDEAENSIVVSPGANARLDPATVAEALAVRPDVVLTQLEVPLDAVAAALSGGGGGRRILNPAPFDGAAVSLLDRVDVVVPNQTELAGLTGADRPPTNVAEAVDLVRLGLDALEAVVVTLGGEGAVAVSGGQVHVVRPPAVEVVDTTGAGDAFCGGLATALGEGAELVDAVRFAVAVGAAAVRRLGAQAALPDRAAAELLAEAVT